MKLTIIVPGNMGRAIANRALTGGHSVTFVGKTLENAQKAADAVKASAKQGAQVSAATLEDVQPGDVVVLPLWYGTNLEVAKHLAKSSRGRP
jgi:predicted dinucleotide-binding enzyme